MNIKIKASGVYCLVGDDYDKIYSKLRQEFGNGSQQLFTERTPGSDYLQWELPGDGWTPLSSADPLTAAEVRRQWLQRQQGVTALFANPVMAQRLMAVPDESFVFYRTDPDGTLLIRQVAWGYRYPERVGTTGITGHGTESQTTEPVRLKFHSDGIPLAGKTFQVNGLDRVTDADGTWVIGDLPVGYEFDVTIDGHQHHLTVTKGEGDIVIDATRPATITVKARFNNAPYSGAPAFIECGRRQFSQTLDTNGITVVNLPYAENTTVKITVDSKHTRTVDLAEQTVVEFDLNDPIPSPEPPTPPVPPTPPTPPIPPIPPDPPTPPVPPVPPTPDPDPDPNPDSDTTVKTGTNASRVKTILLGLLLGVLTVGTFALCAYALSI